MGNYLRSLEGSSFFDGGFPEAKQEKQRLVPVLPVAPAQPGVWLLWLTSARARDR